MKNANSIGTKKQRRGQALVEMAFVVTILLFLSWALFSLP